MTRYRHMSGCMLKSMCSSGFDWFLAPHSVPLTLVCASLDNACKGFRNSFCDGVLLALTKLGCVLLFRISKFYIKAGVAGSYQMTCLPVASVVDCTCLW